MYCPKCHLQIDDDAVFCTECGADLRSAAAPEPAAQPAQEAQPAYAYQHPQQTYPYQQQPSYGYQQPQQSYPYQQPTYAYQQPSYNRPASAIPERAPKISKAGFIVSIILSALALSFHFINTMAYAEYHFDSGAIVLLRTLIVFAAFVILFVFSLLLRKIPTLLTFIPLAMITFLALIRFWSWLLHIKPFGMNYYFETESVIYFLMEFSAVILYFITMLIKSRPLALRIITTVMLSGLIIMEMYYYFADLEYYYNSEYAFVDFLGTFAFVFMYTVMIIVVLTSKRAESRPAQSDAVQ